jgi:hypothetical protein
VRYGPNYEYVLLVDFVCAAGNINAERNERTKSWMNTTYNGKPPKANVELVEHKVFSGLFYFKAIGDIESGTELFASYSEVKDELPSIDCNNSSDDNSVVIDDFIENDGDGDNEVTASQAQSKEQKEKHDDDDYTADSSQ